MKHLVVEIKIAKIHREATRPLKKIKDLTEEEIKNNSCPCCGLPTQICGKLEDFKMCDSPDEISNCGNGVILYFSFFKFCIIVCFIGTIGISFFDSYISYNYYYELQNFCDILPDEYKKDYEYNPGQYGNNYDYNYDNNYLNPYNYFNNRLFNSSKNKCKVYSSNNLTTHKLFNSFFFKVSLVNFRNYRILSKQLNNSTEKNKNKSTIINLHIVNFICIITIFISYLAYTFFMYNKSNAANYLVYTVGDYSIFLTNLNDIYKIFDENLKYIQNEEIKYNNSNKKLNKNIYEDKLGFEPEENMPKLEAFKKFLQKKILVKQRKNKKESLQYYDIKRIDLCYEINEIINLQKEIEELDEKIHRIEFGQSIIEKNKKKGINGDKRIYYSCCLCCKTEESLEQIKYEKEEKEKKLNELIESSRENISEHFCGSAFVTFNTIKEQEDCLIQNKNICGRQLDELIIFLKLYFYYFCCGCCCFCCSCDTRRDSLNYYKRKIIFERAPEPEDIIFENLEGSLNSKINNILCATFVSTIIVGISLVINSLLFYFQSTIDKSEDPNGKTFIIYVLSFLISIANSIIDFIIEIVLEKIIKSQNSYTLTNFYATYSLALTFIWFLNSCILPLALDFVNSKEEHEVLTSNMIIKFLFNSFVQPIMWTINIKFLYKKFKKCIIEQKEKINYNQKELNELYELQSMNVAAKYSYLGKTLLISFVFAPIFPLGFCISFIGFIFGYWLEKFNFSKMYKKPEKLDKQIAEYYINYFAIIFSAYYIGSYYFILDFDNFEIWNWINYIYMLFIYYFRRCFLIDFFKIKESEIHKKTYDDMYLEFVIDYERSNPVTRIEGEMRYLDKLEEKNKINPIEKDRRKRTIKEENQMKFYLRRQRISRIANIKELNNLLNLDDDAQKKEKDIICNIEPIIENDKKEGKIFKIKKSKIKTRKSNVKHANNESETSFPSHYLMNKENSIKTTIKYS